MSTIKEDINEVKMKQNMIEDKVKEAEDKMAKKYDDMANKVENLENKIKELEARKGAEVEEREKTFPALQPAGRTCPDLQPHQEVIHPEGGLQAHCQPTDLQLDKEESNERIYRIVRQARKTIGFSRISNSNIKEVMGEMGIKDIKEGMEEVIKDFLRWEMAIPEGEISKLQFARIFRKEGNTKPNDDRL